MDALEIKYFIESALLAAGRPLNVSKLQDIFYGRIAPEKQEIRQAIADLVDLYLRQAGHRVYQAGDAEAGGFPAPEPRPAAKYRRGGLAWIVAGALLLAWIHVLIEEDLHDKEYVESYTSGFEQLEASVAGHKVVLGTANDMAQKAVTLAVLLDEGVAAGVDISLLSPLRPAVSNPQPMVDSSGEVSTETAVSS